MNKLCKALQVDKLAVPVVGVSFDEMEIRSGLTYVQEIGLLAGCVNGPISEKSINDVDRSKIPTLLATKVMMIHITTIDGKASVPFMHIPTNCATTAKTMFKLVCWFFFLLSIGLIVHVTI